MVLLAVVQAAAPSGMGMLEVRHGYFWDPLKQEYFIPRGVAYQTWNPPVGANQSFAQIDYDLREFKKMHANSVRCDFTWGELEIREGTYDWSKTDFLIAKAAELGLRLFVLVGYQYPPSWVPREYRGVNDRYTTTTDPALVETNVLSDVINYEHPEARRLYANHIAAVTSRYRHSPAIGGWILGNEYAYYDLWEDPQRYPVRRFLGYDPISQAAFRAFLRQLYGGDIAALNARWGSSYVGFDGIAMPRPYPPDRVSAPYHDVIQWRKTSIGEYVAVGALAAAKADPDHLRTYSMVGAVFSNYDANHTCEDARTIVARCAAAGAPLHFWSVNNYAWPSLGSELRSTDFGVAKYQSEVGLPVVVSETGFTSTEVIWPDERAGERQAEALPGALWEQLMAGAAGVHFFHWSDRNQYTPEFFLREQGFGIVAENRKRKGPVYDNIVRMFRQMETIRLDRLLGGSTNPPADIQFFWSTNSDMVWPRANQESCMVWGVLKRLGFQPEIVFDGEFARGDYRRVKALLLCRAYQLAPEQLSQLLADVLPAGVHVHAEADLPGQFDAYHRENPNWAATMDTLFGLGVDTASPGLDGCVTNYAGATLTVLGKAGLGPITPGYRRAFQTWKLWHDTRATSGRVILTHTGRDGTRPERPALVVKDHGAGLGRTALHTFAVGDIGALDGSAASKLALYRVRQELLGAVYRDHFQMQPAIQLTGPGSEYLIPDYRLCAGGGRLLSLLNEQTNAVTVTVTAPDILAGRRVEDLLRGGIIAEDSSGTVEVSVPGDGFVLLYAYSSDPGAGDASLVNPSPHKLWFDTAPLFVWPQFDPYELAVGYDVHGSDLELVVALEQTRPTLRVFARSAALPVQGRGVARPPLLLPDADANDPAYVPSRDGAEYRLRASLLRQGQVLSESSQPVQVSWGVHPAAPLPAPLVPGRTYPIVLRWEDLPSTVPGDPMPLDRAVLWDSAEALDQWYNVVLEVRSQGQIVASDSQVTREGTGQHEFRVTVPAAARLPLTWTARLETAPNVASHDVEESFEGRQRGAQWPDALATDFLAPWNNHWYHSRGPIPDISQNEGVHLEGSHGSQSAFLVVTNLSGLDWSGFGLHYVFPVVWALPENRSEWRDFTFAFDFKEKHGLPHVLELQVEDTDGHWLTFSEPRDPATRSWTTITASLDRFQRAQEDFDRRKIRKLVANVQMLAPAVQYVGSFDNLRFSGPDVSLGGGNAVVTYTSQNDFPGVLSLVAGDLGLALHWSGNGQLQATGTLDGPWLDQTGAQSPLRLDSAAPQRYYRLRQR